MVFPCLLPQLNFKQSTQQTILSLQYNRIKQYFAFHIVYSRQQYIDIVNNDIVKSELDITMLNNVLLLTTLHEQCGFNIETSCSFFAACISLK